MPSKKKKGATKGKGKGAGDRQLVMAKRLDKLPIDELPPFPGPETPEMEVKRILGYKYCSGLRTGNKPFSITTRKGNAFQMNAFSNDMKLERSVDVQVLDDEIRRTWVADYDRNEAEYPVARELIVQRDGIEIMARRARKNISDVPESDVETFLHFARGGEGIEVNCCLEGEQYKATVTIVGGDCSETNPRFVFRTRNGTLTMSFRGCFRDFCLEHYQKDLAFYLVYEILVRVSLGTAEIEGDIDREDLMHAFSEAFRRFCTNEKKWKNHVVLGTFLLDRAIEEKESLNTTVAFESVLGEALEACGFYSQAAMLYAEGGQHLFRAGHRQATVVLRNAGIAWKRSGDFEKAEASYARALQALRFQHNHADYESEAFGILRSLFLVYDEPAAATIAPIKLVATLQALILAGGGKTPAGQRFPFLSAVDAQPIPILRAEYNNASREQMCGVIQSVITRSTSVEGMRKAILSCGQRGVSIKCEVTAEIGGKTRAQQKGDFLRESREYVQGNTGSTGVVAACSACGALKEVKALARCSGCNNEYYCDKACQTKHWRSMGHKAKCRKAPQCKGPQRK